MGHFNKINLSAIITLILSIFASNVVCRPLNGSVEDDSCGYPLARWNWSEADQQEVAT